MKIDNPLRNRSRGFTLIELLVVITIIAILATAAVPVFGKMQRRARLSDSLSNAKQVALALKMYAADSGGNYPATTSGNDGNAQVPLTAGSTSNLAFECLIPRYTNVKVIFTNKNSGWCRGGVVDVNPTDSTRLGAGQNDWMYFLGLAENSDSRWPLFATATAPGTVTYSNLTTNKGGVWEGSDALIGQPDGSVRMIAGDNMDVRTKTATFPKRPDNPTLNMFTATEDWLGTSVVLLYPTPATGAGTAN